MNNGSQIIQNQSRNFANRSGKHEITLQLYHKNGGRYKMYLIFLWNLLTALIDKIENIVKNFFDFSVDLCVHFERFIQNILYISF